MKTQNGINIEQISENERQVLKKHRQQHIGGMHKCPDTSKGNYQQKKKNIQ